MIRAAGKVAGMGMIRDGLRSFQSIPAAEVPVSAAARKASRPVSAIISSRNDEPTAPVQRPVWELDEWEFAGGEEEAIVDSGESMARVVFGGVPTINEAKEATSELKDALERVYLKPPSTKPEDSYTVGQEHSSKACVSSEAPMHAIQAFRMLSESPAAQTVVASIACDQNVWDALMQNEALMEYIQSQKTGDTFPTCVDLSEKGSVAGSEFQDQVSQKHSEQSIKEVKSEDFGTGFMDFIQEVKVQVVDMVSNFLTNYIQNIFSTSATAGNKSASDGDGSESETFMERTLGASFVALATMVIMVVLLKRA